MGNGVTTSWYRPVDEEASITPVASIFLEVGLAATSRRGGMRAGFRSMLCSSTGAFFRSKQTSHATVDYWLKNCRLPAYIRWTLCIREVIVATAVWTPCLLERCVDGRTGRSTMQLYGWKDDPDAEQSWIASLKTLSRRKPTLWTYQNMCNRGQYDTHAHA